MDETQREWERRYGRIAAAAAALAALLLLAQAVVTSLVVFGDGPDTDRGSLLAVHEHPGGLVAAAVLQGLSALALVVVFWYLFRLTRSRRPELPAALVFLVYAGPVLYLLGNVLGALDRVDTADTFASGVPIHGKPGENRASDLLKDTDIATVVFQTAGQLMVAILYVLISLNAMRVGLLSRFTGYVGVIVGALIILPLFAGGSLVIDVFWLGSLAYLFLGRWPSGGRGPAWESGVAEPWPTPAQRRKAEAEDSAPAEPETPARRSSRKRRRKRR